MAGFGVFLSIFVGGAAGSLLRGLLGLAPPSLPFLTASFGINILACFLLGLIHAARHRLPSQAVTFGAVGFCGGLSTFSSFVLELDRLAAGGLALPLSALSLEIALGLCAALAGDRLGYLWAGPKDE